MLQETKAHAFRWRGVTPNKLRHYGASNAAKVDHWWSTIDRRWLTIDRRWSTIQRWWSLDRPQRRSLCQWVWSLFSCLGWILRQCAWGRFRQALHRRRYSVSMPNSLWHIDGYHKLIRWRIVIHGGIHGYSRLPVYRQASTNNLADTVLNCFLSAVATCGLPSRVRCDRGGENARVSEFMLCHPSVVLVEEAALREGIIRGSRGSGETFMCVCVYFMTYFAHLKKKEYWIPQMDCTCSPCITFSCLASTSSWNSFKSRTATTTWGRQVTKVPYSFGLGVLPWKQEMMMRLYKELPEICS